MLEDRKNMNALAEGDLDQVNGGNLTVGNLLYEDTPTQLDDLLFKDDQIPELTNLLKKDSKIRKNKKRKRQDTLTTI